ncbi:SDR family NAD(P)-dependent oxidoreductase [Pseudomonas allokribbensis]|uniref:SDR family NAD(P)-dependent oxidoreductase n=1 Tax=Pseudomonas allokribbensis TaxID=2774460 RepID=UPI0017882CA5|nr:SDR family NAD(P)-dependent oxidoreductase [Pseudomonas allokribbensis]
MKNYALKDRVVAITGGTGGLGMAVAKALRARGALIALLDLDGAVAGEKARVLGGNDVAAGWQADVCSLGSVETAMASVARHFGGIDVVIAGAGIGIVDSMASIDPRLFERHIDINLNGVFRTFRAALPYVQARKGYMMAISSMAAFVHGPLNGHYAASKAGVWALCDSVRLEVRHLGVGVGSVHPTFFKTPMMDAVQADPIGNKVWGGNEKGLWKMIELDEVVTHIVEGIERRRDMVIVPKRNSLVAWMPGILRRVVEAVGFKQTDIVESIRLAREGKRDD